MRISVGQHRQTQRVEHFHAAHIHAHTDRAGKIKWKEVEIVVGVKRIAIEFDVALDMEVLARFQC